LHITEKCSYLQHPANPPNIRKQANDPTERHERAEAVTPRRGSLIGPGKWLKVQNASPVGMLKR
jgi:hypothetical protein